MMDHKTVLQRYLVQAREAMLWKLDGLSEYDVRRPMTPSGTNLLGLVKHVGTVAVGYLGDCMGRPFGEQLPWADEDAEPNADLWATADETREQIVDLWHRCWRHADETIAALGLDAPGHVGWWPEERREVTLQLLMVHVVTEVNRHAGHADILRELIDGRTGHRADRDNMWLPADPDAYRQRLEGVARSAAG
ncbi:MAG: hypothetical protein JWN31_1013 [Frankiales bacterium]|nr:hypothetical protein [Frankiales bacterium]